MTLKSINPYDNSLIGEYEEYSEEEVNAILDITAKSFGSWNKIPYSEKAVLMRNAAKILRRRRDTYAKTITLEMGKSIQEAGFPSDIFNILIIGSDKISKVIENENVKVITLTGSELAGAAVASLAGKNIKKTVLELGGSNAFIVFDDTNIDEAVKEAVSARFMNCGQSCIASKRFLIQASITDRFTAKLKAEVEKLKVGNPLENSTQLGPVATIAQALEVERQVNESIRMGALPLMQIKRDGAFFHPVILTHVKPGMPIFDEEVFGPALPISTFQTDKEAVDLANNSKFGLGVTLFTTNMERAERLIPLFEEGAVFVNSLVKSDPRLPFGGIKKSGYGRELSAHGIREFVNVKTIYFS